MTAMQNEQTPAAGPLNAESVALLKRGDWLIHPQWGVAQYEPESEDCRFLTGPWSFLGRPDQDGWIKGSAYPDGLLIDVKWKHDRPWLGRDDAHTLDRNQVTHWRPHVPSPASSSSVVQGDASGVEREVALELRKAKARLLQRKATLGDMDAISDAIRALEDIGRPTPVFRPAGEGVDLESGEARTKVVDIVERYVTGWGGEYADNPYEAAPLLAGEILSLFRPQPTAGEGEAVACTVPPAGWSCSRVAGHDGPCAASPINAHETAVIRGLRRWLEWDFDGSDTQLREGATHVLNALHDDRILSLLSPAAPDAGGGWRDVSTIPLNERVLVWVRGNLLPGVRFGSAYKSGDKVIAKPEGANGDWSRDVTHWMPLPASPALQPGGER